MAVRQEFQELAWAGWSTRVPVHWRPLRIAGTWERGELVLGNAMQTVLQITWERPKKRRFDVEQSLAAWHRRATPKESAGTEVSTSADFTHSRAVLGEAVASGKQLFWCGYSRTAHVVLECRGRPALSEADADALTGQVLPKLRTSASGQPVRWVVFGSAFTSPPRFTYARHKLTTGNVGLQFTAPHGQQLTVRQVYPADLALQRRELVDWLEEPLFKDNLTAIPEGVAETCEIESGGCRLAGLRRRGRKSLPRIFRFVTRRRFTQAVVHDLPNNRLRLATCEAPRKPSEEVIGEVLAGMGVGKTD